MATGPTERIRKSHSFTIRYATCIKTIGILAVISKLKANVQEADVEMGVVLRKGADYQVCANPTKDIRHSSPLCQNTVQAQFIPPLSARHQRTIAVVVHPASKYDAKFPASQFGLARSSSLLLHCRCRCSERYCIVRLRLTSSPAKFTKGPVCGCATAVLPITTQCKLFGTRKPICAGDSVRGF